MIDLPYVSWIFTNKSWHLCSGFDKRTHFTTIPHNHHSQQKWSKVTQNYSLKGTVQIEDALHGNETEIFYMEHFEIPNCLIE